MELNTFLIIVSVIVGVTLLVIGGIYLSKKIKVGMASYNNMAKLYKNINQSKSKPVVSKPKTQRKKKPKQR